MAEKIPSGSEKEENSEDEVFLHECNHFPPNLCHCTVIRPCLLTISLFICDMNDVYCT